jgi:excisionase family DNA binding protein
VIKPLSKHKILQIDVPIHASRAKQQKVIGTDLLLTDDDMKLLTKRQAADLLGVTLHAITAWIYQRRLRSTKVGSCTRISLAEIKRFVLAQNPHLQHLENQERIARLKERVRQMRHRETIDGCEWGDRSGEAPVEVNRRRCSSVA